MACFTNPRDSSDAAFEKISEPIMPFRKIVDRVLMIALDTGQRSLGLYLLKRKASNLDANKKKRKKTEYLL